MNNKTRTIDPIGWSLQNPFPATVTIGTDYEAVYQLVSNLPAPMPLPLTVTYTGGSDFTVEDQCSGLFLVPGQTCNVTVRFSPSTTGVQQFQLTLHYFNDVVPLPVQTMTAGGSTNLIVGSVTQALPATTVVESIYPVIFTFQNVSGSAATNLDLQRNYPADFTEENNTCSTTLAAGASCIVQGSLIPSAPGNYEVAADLYYAESVTPASVSTSTDAIEIIVTGAVTTPLPDPTVVGDSFPVVFTYTNNSALPATSVNITTNYPPGFTQQSDNCTGTLNANSSCTIQGTFTPATAGVFNVAVSLAYAESNNPVPLSTSTTADIGALGIVGDVTTPLPATTSIDVSYPVVFTYTNEGSVTATSLVITPTYPPGFIQQSNTCSGSLPVGAACTVTGTLLPTSAGNYTVDVSLAYAQSVNPVPLSTSTSAIVVNITGDVSTPLPTTTALNTSYPVVFSYTNNSSITATGLVLTPNYPTGFTENNNTCSSGTLAAGQTCSIEGNFIPASAGTHTVATSLTYAGAPAAIPLSTSTNTLAFVLTGEVSTPLPGALQLENEYPVVFTYTNASPLPATNLVFTPNYPTDFMPETNTCTSSLASNSSCAVSGTLIPTNNTPPGPVTVGLNLTYSEGAAINLTTSSTIQSSVILTGTVLQSLPATETASATPLPVVFQYTNDGNTPATGLTLTPNYPPEFTQDSNTCTGTLGVDASCQITGNLNISATGNYSVSVTLDTAETSPLTLTTQTTIIAAEVVGSIEQGLPSSTVVNTDYPVTFLFTNEGAVDATAVNIAPNYPSDFQQTSNTCGATLAAGASCRVQGILTPTSEGTQTVGVTFSYAEGSNIPLSTSTTVGALILQGIVQQGFPDVTSPNISYPLIFRYDNNNPADATGLNLSGTVPPGLDITSNTCMGTLAANSSCTIQASFTPTTAGSYTAGVTLSYDQGAPIPLNTYTVTADAANTLLIAVGDTGFCRTSPNWSTWTSRPTSGNVTQTGITFSPQLQLFAIVGNQNGTAGIVRTTSNGVSYTNNLWAPTFLPQYVTWSSDLSQFLAVGANGGIATSTNGINYVPQTSGVGITLRGAIWNSQFQEYVVVGNNGTILTSTNGIDWDQETSGTTDNLISVTWSPQLGIYVIATLNANDAILNSNDGSTWTSPGISFPFFAPRSVTWSPLVNRFLIVGTSGSTGASSNGTTWTNEQTLVGNNINDVIWYNRQGRFYAVGNSTWVYYSTSGIGDMRSKVLDLIGAPNILAIAAGAFVP
ncbi:choice-of-anchor D domain-containing protein [Rickettsiella endosymbiont of Xylota segnis]|uniref:beta strand repeat-containing protein n=1 Tax=Rickettsiella endosymbiont of Xylota segnis TaxID=3066238 RepID=UPI0030D0BF8F